MKLKLFVLPLCLSLAFCSRKTVPPPPTGVSNVKVGSGDTMTSASGASSKYTNADRDWAYKSNRDTSLNGTWMLDGMMSADGGWASTEVRDSISGAVASADTAMAIGSPSATASTGKGKKNAASRNKNRNALYAGAQSRLKMQYKAGTSIDTSALEPYKYWKRTPTLMLNAGIFNGNTGCNSMSGRVNYDDKDFRFNPTVNTSKMMCNEYDEANFMSLLKRVDNYSMSGNMLELRQGSTRLLSFRKS